MIPEATSGPRMARRTELQLLGYEVIPHDDRRITYSALSSGDYASCMAAGFHCANKWWLETNGGALHELIRYRHVTAGPLVSLTFRVSGVRTVLLLGLAEGTAAQGIALELDGGSAASAPVSPSDVASGVLQQLDVPPGAEHAVTVRYNGTDRLSIVALALDTSSTGLVLPTTSTIDLEISAGAPGRTTPPDTRGGQPLSTGALDGPARHARSRGSAVTETAIPSAPEGHIAAGPSSPRVLSTAGIAGSAAGGVIAVIILFLLLVCCIRLRRSGRAAPEVPPTTVDPYPIFPSVSHSNLAPKRGLIEEVKFTDGEDELPVDGPSIGDPAPTSTSSPMRWGLWLLLRRGKKDRRGALELGPSDRGGQPPRYAA